MKTDRGAVVAECKAVSQQAAATGKVAHSEAFAYADRTVALALQASAQAMTALAILDLAQAIRIGESHED